MKKIAIVLAVMVLLSLCGCCVSVFEEEPTFLTKDLPKELSSKYLSDTIKCSVTIEDATFSYKDRGSISSGLTITDSKYYLFRLWSTQINSEVS